MSYFHARWLFDGEQWLADQYFEVDDKGCVVSCLVSNGAEKANISKQLSVVIPGFVICHSHSFQRAMAGLGERISLEEGQDRFWSWREQMYHLVQSLNPDTFKQIADWLYVEMLESGYTSVGEFHYLHNKPNGERPVQWLKMNTGFLKDGFCADFVELRSDDPAMLREDPATLWDEMIFSGGRELVKNVFSGGKQVVFDGKHSLHDDKLEALRAL
jgi:cytosine/adenosine deaminase-related metal-dependent hydrolase